MKRCLQHAMLAAICALLSTGCSKKETAETASPGEGAPAASRGKSASGDAASGMPGAREINEAAENLKKAAPVVGADMGNAMKAMGNVMSQSENVTITPVDFRTLKELLPDTLAGLPRKTREGQRQMGMSEATAEYGDENGDSSFSVKIADTGNMRALLAGPAAYAMSLDMDKETDNGYERNLKFQGFIAHEKMEGDNGEMTVLVGGRFVVEVQGYNIKPAQLKTAMEALSLKKLDGMKDEGVEKSTK